jgi:hypothetical protein
MLILLFMMAQGQAQAGADDAAASEAIKTFEATFAKAKDAAGKIDAVMKLAEVKHEKVISKLQGLISHDEKPLRIAVGQALATFLACTPELKKSAGKALTGGLSAGANVRDSEVLSSLLTSLGALQEETTSLTVRTYFDNKDVKIASAAVAASGQIRSKTLVEPLIELLRECEKITQPPPPPPPSGGKVGKSYGGSMKRPAQSSNQQNDPEAQKHDRAQQLQPLCQSALQSITLKTDIPTGEKWMEWWNKNRATFTVTKQP